MPSKKNCYNLRFLLKQFQFGIIRLKIIAIIPAFSLGILFTNCQDLQISPIPEKALLSRVDAKDTLKLTRNAKTIINKYINLGSGWTSVRYEGELDWKTDPFRNASWKNYFYSLRMIGILSQAFSIDKNPNYLDEGKLILKSWDDNYRNDDLLANNYKFVWADHAVANRVINLIHFYNNLKKSNRIDDTSEFIIKKHLFEYGDWLADDRNYTKGNHAVMMDRALLYLSYVLKSNLSQGWRKKALDRFDTILSRQVSTKGVCTENSPQYHPYMMDLILDFMSITKNFGDSPKKNYEEIFEKMKDYLVYVLKPDLTYPFQGDTYPVTKKLKFSEKYKDSRLEYIESQGKNGKQPNDTDIIFKDAGYAILRDKWPTKSEFENTTYINFISGVPSRVHKHSDNLSLFLYSNGEDLLIDHGSWGYSKNDTVSYLNSTWAHNTSLINNLEIKNFPVKSCKIIESEIHESYSIVKGQFSPNPFEIFCRTLVYIKPNIVILDDEVYSEMSIESVSQIFNLSTSLKKVDLEPEKGKIIASSDKNTLEIDQLLDNDYEIKQFNGTKGIRGLYAERAEKSTKGNQIVFHNTRKEIINELRNITLITVKNNQKDNINELEFYEKGSNPYVIWKDRDNQKRVIYLEGQGNLSFHFSEILNKSHKYNTTLKNKNINFEIQELNVYNWAKNEFSFIFKLNENAGLDEIKKYTLGIRGYADKEDFGLLSTYAKQTNRDFDSWNLKADVIYETEHGKFISINVSTDLPKFSKLKLFLFHRDGYKGEQMTFTINNFYLYQNEIFEKWLKSARLISENILEINKQIVFDEMSVTRLNDETVFFLKLGEGVEKSWFKKYKLGFHTYIEEKDKAKMMAYSKAKNRNYDAWDFVPEIKTINGEKYIVKTLNTPIRHFPKIRMFFYDKDGYKGIVGKAVEVQNINTEQ